MKPSDIQYAPIYDSFTITVLMQLEDLGFCAKGEGRFVSDGNLITAWGGCRSTPTAAACATTIRPTAVKLEEGPTMMTNIVDCDFDAIKVGWR